MSGAASAAEARALMAGSEATRLAAQCTRLEAQLADAGVAAAGAQVRAGACSWGGWGGWCPPSAYPAVASHSAKGFKIHVPCSML